MEKLEAITETLIKLGTAFEETGQPDPAAIIAQCISDMAAIHATLEQL